MTASELRELCLGLPGAREEFPFRPQLTVVTVGGRMFALSALAEQPLRISVKCEPELGESLRATYPAIVPGYHLNKRHWLTITVDRSLPDGLVVDLVRDSYELVSAARPPALHAPPDFSMVPVRGRCRRFGSSGRRAHRTPKKRRKLGYGVVHVIVHDHSRLAVSSLVRASYLRREGACGFAAWSAKSAASARSIRSLRQAVR